MRSMKTTAGPRHDSLVWHNRRSMVVAERAEENRKFLNHACVYPGWYCWVENTGRTINDLKKRL